MESVVDWSTILHELLVEIAIRIRLVEDFMAFRGVCTSWRAAATKDKFGALNKFRPRVPLLMLAEKTARGSDEREFYSLLERNISMKLHLPEAKCKKCIEVKFGWLLTLSPSGEAALLNPWSRAVIELPNYTTFPDYYDNEPDPGYTFIERAVLSANPSDTQTSNSFVLLVIATQLMGFWRPGDKNWTKLESELSIHNMSITYYNQKFYGITYWGKFWAWDPSTGTDELIFTVDQQVLYLMMLTTYLVVSSDGLDLLLITRNGRDVGNFHGYGASNFRVFGIDVMKREWKQMDCLPNEDAVFVGENAAISVPASAPPGGIKSNCIYFTDDCVTAYSQGDDPDAIHGGGKDMGVYSIAEGSIEKFDVTSFSFICPPLWITPSSY